MKSSLVSFKVRHLCARLWSTTALLRSPVQQFSIVLRFNISSGSVFSPDLCIWTSYCVPEMYCSYFALYFIYRTTLQRIFRRYCWESGVNNPLSPHPLHLFGLHYAHLLISVLTIVQHCDNFFDSLHVYVPYTLRRSQDNAVGSVPGLGTRRPRNRFSISEARYISLL
jgi:hypothetical protein